MDLQQNHGGGEVGPLIRLDGVSRIFINGTVETEALSGIELEIGQGEFVAVTGPSGCGKSTLLSLLGLLDVPSLGRYFLDGGDVTHLNPSRKARIRNQRIGFIFQAFNLIGDMTVEENVELPLTHRTLSRSDRKARVKGALDRVGMTHRTEHYPGQLSGGQQQRVAVARAIVGRPSILLADEPTGNLDSKSSQGVMELLKEIHREGSTVCLVTHEPAHADQADRRVKLVDGRIVGSDPRIAEPIRPL